MSTVKRIFAWILVVLSIIGILACLAGIFGSWVLNGRLTDGILRLVTGVQSGLSSVEGSLTRASDQLNATTVTLQTIQEAASQLGTRIEENTPLLDRITSLINGELTPSINAVRELFQPILEGVLAVNGRLETLNALPGIQLPTLTNQIEALNDRIQEMNLAVQQLQASIEDFKTGVVENLLVPFLAKIDEIANRLTVLEQTVNGYLEQINQLQVAVESLQVKIPTTIDAVTIALSILLIWLVLAQISMILVASVYLKTGRMVWEFANPGKQPADGAVLEPGS